MPSSPKDESVLPLPLDADAMEAAEYLDAAITRWRSGADGPACHDNLRLAHEFYARWSTAYHAR